MDWFCRKCLFIAVVLSFTRFILKLPSTSVAFSISVWREVAYSPSGLLNFEDWTSELLSRISVRFLDEVFYKIYSFGYNLDLPHKLVFPRKITESHKNEDR